jgi:RNA polymerase sigma-70 factor (ECF subfamily)
MISVEKKESIKMDCNLMYQSYYRQIYVFIYRLTGNAEETSDLVHETFLKLYLSLKKGLIPENSKAWIYRIASNTCFTFLKRRAKFRDILKKKSEEFLGDSESAPYHPRNKIEQNLILKERLASIRKAFDKLPLKDRLILELFQNGLSYPEIARVLKMKEISIGKKLFRARRNLAQYIREEERQ